MTVQELVDAVRADGRRFARSTLVQVMHDETVTVNGSLQRLRPGVLTLRRDAAGPTRWTGARAWVLDALVARHERDLGPASPRDLVADLEQAGLRYSRRAVNYALAAMVAGPSSGVTTLRFGRYEFRPPRSQPPSAAG